MPGGEGYILGSLGMASGEGEVQKPVRSLGCVSLNLSSSGLRAFQAFLQEVSDGLHLKSHTACIKCGPTLDAKGAARVSANDGPRVQVRVYRPVALECLVWRWQILPCFEFLCF